MWRICMGKYWNVIVCSQKLRPGNLCHQILRDYHTLSDHVFFFPLFLLFFSFFTFFTFSLLADPVKGKS